MPVNNLTTKITDDSYEAAYYLMCGARFVSVKSRSVPVQKIKKMFIRHHWTIELNEVPVWASQKWKDYEAFGSLRDFVSARVRLKKKILEKLKY